MHSAEFGMDLRSTPSSIPLTGAKWARKSEAYATLVADHLCPQTVWLDAGCGSRLLENDMDPLEDWLASQCKSLFGMDIAVTSHRNIKSLLQGSLYQLPFLDSSLDLITCRMVVEHLDRPRFAFSEVARCLRPGGACIVMTPNLGNYGVFGNAIATKLLPDKLRLRMVHATDSRSDEDIFPVRYKAKTMNRIIRLLTAAGLQVHERIGIRQHGPYFRKYSSLEQVLMKLTPVYVLMVCAHRRGPNSARGDVPCAREQATDPSDKHT
jgi:SAM-dependent methyltransferase